jgi:hypothetical protein
MKNIFTVCVMLALAGVDAGQSYERPIGRQKPVRPIATPPPISERQDVQGAIPRGLRGGNPLQMLNPKAPAKYGTAGQSVVIDPYTGKWKGIKLFEIFF